eukprot:3932220-Rhodomonas_salina.2
MSCGCVGQQEHRNDVALAQHWALQHSLVEHRRLRRQAFPPFPRPTDRAGAVRHAHRARAMRLGVRQSAVAADASSLRVLGRSEVAARECAAPPIVTSCCRRVAPSRRTSTVVEALLSVFDHLCGSERAFVMA